MTAITTPVADGTSLGDLLLGYLVSRNRLTSTDGTPINPATAEGVEAVRALLAGTLAVSMAAPPAGAATSAKQDAVKASVDALVPYVDGLEGLLTAIGTALAGTLAVTGPLTAAQLGQAALATAGKQDTGNAALAAIVTALGAALPLPTGAASEATLARTASADDAFAIAPSDTANLGTIPKALLVTAAGTLSVQGSSGMAISLGSVTAGQVIPLRARRVMATGTTATVVGLI